MTTAVKPDAHYKPCKLCEQRASEVVHEPGHELVTPGRARRFLYLALGVAFVALGAVGAVLPVIPTVGPLLLASWFFARSYPPLERKLVRNRFFRKFHHYLDYGAEMPFRARVITIAAMWLSIGASIGLLYSTGQERVWLVVLILAAGVVGTWFIARFRGKVAGRAEVNSGGRNS